MHFSSEWSQSAAGPGAKWSQLPRGVTNVSPNCEWHVTSQPGNADRTHCGPHFPNSDTNCFLLLMYGYAWLYWTFWRERKMAQQQQQPQQQQQQQQKEQQNNKGVTFLAWFCKKSDRCLNQWLNLTGFASAPFFPVPSITMLTVGALSVLHWLRFCLQIFVETSRLFDAVLFGKCWDKASAYSLPFACQASYSGW